MKFIEHRKIIKTIEIAPKQMRCFFDKLSESLFRRTRISQRLLITFILLTLIPLCIVGLVSVKLSTMAIQENISNYSIQILGQVNYNFTHELNKLEDLSMELMTSDPMREFDNSMRKDYPIDRMEALKKLEELFYSKVSGSKDIASIAFYPLNHGLVAGTDILISASNQNEAGIFNRIMSSYGNPVWIYMKNKETDLGIETDLDTTPTIKVGTPVLFRKISSMYDGSTLGVMHIAPQKKWLYKICSDIEIGKKGKIIIIDSGNRILTCSEAGLIGKYIYPELRKKLQEFDQSNGFFFTNISKTKMLVCYSKIQNYGWKVISVIPFENLTIRINQIVFYVLWIMAFCVLVSLVISYMVTRSVSLPLNRINVNLKYLGKSDFSRKLDIKYQDELSDLSNGFNKMTNEIQSLINEVYVITIEKLNSDFKALQSQINPHFLYNSLESINSLALIKKEWEISEMVRGLAAMFRYNIKSDDATITLKDEIEHVKLYILLQALRYEDRIQMEYDIPENLMQARVFKFMLQPLIENSIVHGLEKVNRKGLIRIIVSSSEEKLFITVTDNGIGMDENRLKKIRMKLFGERENRIESVQVKDSIGLMNIQLRIILQYGKDYGITVDSIEGSGTNIGIIIPLQL